MERVSTAARVSGSIVACGSLMLALALGASGCGGSSGQGADGAMTGGDPNGVASCTVSLVDGTQTLNMICVEGSGAALRSALQVQCNASVDAGGSGVGLTSVGHFAQAPCSHDGALGGCLSAVAGMSQTGWYYMVSGISADQVRQLCAMAGATFVAP